MTGVGTTPFPLPLGVDIDKWLRRAKTPWDAFPDTGSARWMPKVAASTKPCAIRTSNFARSEFVERLLVEADGKRIAGVEVTFGGGRQAIAAKIVVLRPARSIPRHCC